MRKKMTVAVLSILTLLALVFIIGLLLPQERVFIKTAELKSKPDKVFRLVTEVENQTTWRSDLQQIQVIDKNTWTEIPKKGTPITFRTKRKIDNQLFEIEIIAPSSFSGYWVGIFEETEKGTKITFKEVIVIKNPFLRVLSAVFVNLDQTMELYLNDLQSALGY